MNTLVDVWNELIEQVDTIEVVFGMYGGNYDFFTNHNYYLLQWINKYGDCKISKIVYENDFEDGSLRAIVYLDGWNNGGKLIYV